MITPALKHLSLPANFPEGSRVWIYQSDRSFNEAEVQELKNLCNAFTAQWTAHSRQLRATSGLYFSRFLSLFADEDAASASGCSIDSSVRFIQGLERRFDCSFTNRMLMAYLDGDQVKSLDLKHLPDALASGIVNSETLVFNNLVANLADMKDHWMQPLGESWFMRFA
jgi:hypothetical protein